MKKLLLFSILCLLAFSMQAQSVPEGYVDLGLPSGTFWKDSNESGFYSYDDAVERFGSKLPSKEQWSELMNYCTWIWTGTSYKVSGRNGKSIVLYASGFQDCGGDEYDVETKGYYSSSTPDGEEYEDEADAWLNGDAWILFFDADKVYLDESFRCFYVSVRLVQK